MSGFGPPITSDQQGHHALSRGHLARADGGRTAVEANLGFGFVLVGVAG
jgi:hypothetical protein